MHLSDGIRFSSSEAEYNFDRAADALESTGMGRDQARVVVATIAAYTLRTYADAMTGVADVD